MTVRRTDLGLFALILLAAASFHHPVEYDNTSSRFYLLSAVVDYGRLDIDMYKDETIDVSVSGEHTYSNKAIGAPLAAVPVYWFLRHFTPMRDDKPLSVRAEYICRFVTTSAPFALVGVLMFRLLVSLGAAPLDSYATVIAYAFGSIAWIHATLFSGHQMAANSAFLSFVAILFMSKSNADTASLRRLLGFFCAGLLAGLAALADYTAVGISAFLTIFALVKCPRAGERAAFLFGAILMMAPLAAYNTVCFGKPWSFSYSNANLGYQEFAAGAKKGVMGVGLPGVESVLSLLFSPSRGLFFIMPVLIFSLPGFSEMWKRERGTKRRTAAVRPWMCITMAGCVTACFWVAAGFYGWHGGWTFGPRYLVPMLPFLALPMAFAIDRIWFFPLAFLSVAQVGFAQISMPHPPETILNPVVECLMPLFQYGYLSGNFGMKLGLDGWPSILPWLMITLWLAWMIRGWILQEFSSAARRAETDWDTEKSMAPRRRFYAFIALAVFFSLILVRTRPSRHGGGVHELNARLLQHAAYTLSSGKLARAALREHEMASGLRYMDLKMEGPR